LLEINIREMTAFIIDDEQNSIDVLHLLIIKHCPNVSIVGFETDYAAAITKINDLNPQIIFLDINLQSRTGFELLNELTIQPGIIFTTAYENFAVTAFKHDAIDYLLKPIDYQELIRAVDKAKTRIGDHRIGSKSISYLDQITVSTSDGIVFLDTKDIIRLEADGGYTFFFLTNDSKFMVSKNLGSFDKIFEYTTCKRVHKSHIVNLRHVKKLNKTDRIIEMSNGDEIPIPRERLNNFMIEMADFQR
jgi:two-component system, LytTR family, response regulator